MLISVSSGHFALRYEVPKFLARGGHLCTQCGCAHHSWWLYSLRNVYIPLVWVMVLVEWLLGWCSTRLFRITIVVYSLAMLQLTAAVHVLRYLPLISTGTVLVYRYRRSIAQVCACERPTGYIKYESLYDSESNTWIHSARFHVCHLILLSGIIKYRIRISPANI